MAQPKQNPGPLTNDDLKRMRELLAQIDVAVNVAETAIRGGIDMSGELKTLNEQRAQLLKLKQAFFPGQ